MALSKVINRLLELPLFQGISTADLSEIAGHTRFGFTKLAAGKTIVSEGEQCDALRFVTDGTFTATVRADDGSYMLTEELEAPRVLQPERLFGMTQRYSRDFTAQTQCNMLTISKTQVVQLTEKYEVFRINLLNIITTQTQRQERQPLRQQPTQIREKIMRFVTDRSIYPTGRKTLNVKMEVLARLIGESRQNVSDELHRMEKDGVIELRRGIISMMPYKEYRHL